MDCINYSSSEYKSLLRDSGLSKLELDAAILTYQEDNNTDSYPDLESIKITKQEPTSLQKTMDTVRSLKNENLVYGTSDLFTGVFLNTFEPVTDDHINRIKELATNDDVSFVKDHISTELFFDPKTDRLTRDKRAISGTMFQNIVEKMSDIVPNLKVQGLANEDFIEFAQSNGVIEAFNSPTFVVGDTVFYNSEATMLTKDMAIEESLHPVVIGIQNEDPELFKTLFNEAKQYYPELWSDIKNSYKSNYSNELVTQALSREFSDIDKKKMSNNVILRALQTLKSYLNRLFNYNSQMSTDSPKMALMGIVQDLNTKSGDLTPSYDFTSAYLHTLTPRRNDKPYPVIVTNKNFQDFVNKKANDIKSAIELRHKTVKRGIKSNAEIVRNVNRLLRDTSDEKLDIELRRNNVNAGIMSQEQLDLLKGEMIIAKFLDRMHEDMARLSNDLSAITKKVGDGGDTSLSLEVLDDLKINLIDWYNIAQENLNGAFESNSNFFIVYSNYVDSVEKTNTKDGERARHVYYEKYKQLSNWYDNVKSRYDSLRVSLLQKEIRKELIENEAPLTVINDIIDEITSPAPDINWLWVTFGSINYAKDSLLRLMGYYVTEAKQRVNTNLQNDIAKVEQVLEKIRRRANNVSTIYNLDSTFSEYITDDNKADFKNAKKRLSKSGNWITDLNRGQAHKNYRNDLNVLFKNYGIESRDLINTLDYDTRVKFLKDENKIKNKHYERPFISEYYDLLSEIIPEAIDAKADIDELINSMLEPVTVDGVIHTERFTVAEADSYENLLKQKRNLANIYDESGDEKTGIDKEIAESLTKFNKKIQEYNDQKHKAEMSEWRDKYNKLVNDAEQAIKHGSEEDRKKTRLALQNWRKSNVRTTYKQDFWDLLGKVSKNEYGPEYVELQDKRSELMRLYRNTYDLELTVGDAKLDEKLNQGKKYTKQSMSEELKDKIKFLDNRMNEIRKNSERKPIAGLSFKDVAEIETSSEYKAILEVLKPGTTEYTEWFANNHYKVIRKNGISEMVPYSFWNVLTPVNKSFIREEPSNLWNDASKDSGLKNKEFNEDQAENGMVPRRSLYDNTANFNKIKNDPELFELYNLLRNIMKSSQDLLGDMNSGSSLTLPQKTGKFDKRFRSEFDKGRNAGRFKSFFKGVQAIYRDWFIIDQDDTHFNTNEMQDISRFQTSRSNRFIPTYYNRRVQNPDTLTRDIIGSVLEYSRMANNYRQMFSILPKLNLINEQLANRQVMTKGGPQEGSRSNISKKGDSFLSDTVFNRRSQFAFDAGTISEWLFGKPQEGQSMKISVGKPIMMLRNWIVAVNLAWKPVPIIADYTTAQFDIEIEGMVGRYYDSKSLARGKVEFLKSVVPWLLDSGVNKKSNKLVNLMMFNEMAFDRTSQINDYHLSGRGVSKWRSLKNNFMFWGWNTSDYIVKAQVTAAVYMNHKLVNGEIMDKQNFLRKYYPNNKKEGNTAWSVQGKSLYDAIAVDKKTDGFIFNDKAFEKAYNGTVEAYIKGILHKSMSEIDGQLRETDKSSIHNNVFGSYLMMHRGFILANIFKQLRPKSYDFYSRREEYGNYRGAYNFISKVLSSPNIKQNYKDLMSDETNRSIISGFRYTSTSIATWLTIAVLTNILKSNADEDKDELFAQYMAFQLSRIQFETASKFNPLELSSVLENPTAGMGFINNLVDMGAWFKEGDVKSGVYKGMPNWQKQLIKLTPYKNVYETMHADPLYYRRRNDLLYKSNVATNLYDIFDKSDKDKKEKTTYVE